MTICSATRSRFSASLKTTAGFLPPHSRTTFFKLLSDDPEVSNQVQIYASGGVSHAWYENGEQDLIEEALRYKAAGYKTFKFRNGTSWKYSGMTMKEYLPILSRLRSAVGPDFRLVLEKFPWPFEVIINE